MTREIESEPREHLLETRQNDDMAKDSALAKVDAVLQHIMSPSSFTKSHVGPHPRFFSFFRADEYLQSLG